MKEQDGSYNLQISKTEICIADKDYTTHESCHEV